jgi:hypothetical protein
LLEAFTATPRRPASLLAAVKVEYGSRYSNCFSPWQAQVVGSMLALCCIGQKGLDVYSERMLLIAWRASFHESYPDESTPLWVHAAYNFAMCARSKGTADDQQLADAMLDHLRLAFPLPGAGVFDADDIHRI